MKRQSISSRPHLDLPEAVPAASGSPILTGLIGWPVEHSVSPAMHNAAFQNLGLEGRYGLLPAEPQAVASTLVDLRRNGYRGVNVTVPHKQAVIPYLHELTGAAQTIGAVNTILFEGDRMLGHNTDAGGFLAALRKVGCEPAGLRALVLGAGGAARAVVYALASTGCPVSIHNRTMARAEALATDMRSVAGIRGAHNSVRVSAALSDLDPGDFDLLVNTTSVGMWPETKASPWPSGLPLSPDWLVVDLVYNPQETRLLASARAAGATTVGGLGMLVHQGALSFQMWTGHAPPVDVMYAAAKDALARSAKDSAHAEKD